MHNKIPKGIHVTGDARTLLLSDLKYKYLEHGMTIRALAEDSGRAYSTVHRMLGEAGVALRSKGGKPRGCGHGID
ncbi:MAG TPA: helix-turn-helix domain-containing protein [Pseudonocardiaceae bacterium]|nr:helix-turn-helix domain-containing protein [Pseudonocardiaceae bacterium]